MTQKQQELIDIRQARREKEAIPTSGSFGLLDMVRGEGGQVKESQELIQDIFKNGGMTFRYQIVLL